MNKCLVLTIQKLQRIIYNSQIVVILKIKWTTFYFSIGKTFKLIQMKMSPKTAITSQAIWI